MILQLVMSILKGLLATFKRVSGVAYQNQHICVV